MEEGGAHNFMLVACGLGVHSIKKSQAYIIRYRISIKPRVLFRSKDSPRDKPNEDMFRHPCTFLIAKQKGDGPY